MARVGPQRHRKKNSVYGALHCALLLVFTESAQKGVRMVTAGSWTEGREILILSQ
jgi:hypothetical protein